MKADQIEGIFKNVQRIHGKSDCLDWIKIASIRVMRNLEDYHKSRLKEIMPTDQNFDKYNTEIIQRFKNEALTLNKYRTFHDRYGVRCIGYNYALEAMKDYAQSRLKEIMPTDEEIEKKAPYKGFTGGEYLYKRLGWIMCAEWFKSEIEKRNK